MMKTLKSVLLVDDNEDDNFFTRFILERDTFAENIVECRDGEEALKYLKSTTKKRKRQSTPDIIFLDLNMPVMDGWEFLDAYEQMSEDGKEKPVIIILTTSLNPRDISKSKTYSTVKEFRSKPLTPYSLQQIHLKYVSNSW